MASPSQSRVVAGKYAVGLTWRMLISRGPTHELALARAKEEKAKHFVHDGTSTAVGLAYFSKQGGPGRNHTAYSLASMAAKACPDGEAVFVIDVQEPTGWWIGASVNGLPVADTFATSADQVPSIVAKLVEGRKAPTFFGDSAHLPEALELRLDQLETYAKPESMVRGAQSKLPKWIYPVAFGLVALLAYQKGLPWWEARQAALHPKPNPEVNALAEWTAATNAWVASIKKPASPDLAPLRFALHKLPGQVGGWDLQAASCVAAGLWRCTVTYRRPINMASNATNRTFEDARPADWKVTWKGAAELQASFEVKDTVLTQLVVNRHVVPLKAYQVDTYSEFQEISKVFAKVDVTEMAPADIAAPKTPDGQPVPRPSAEQLAEFFRSSVSFSGPIRNLELVEQSKAPIFWREVSLTRSKAEKTSLILSEFQGVLRGDIYAKDR